MTGGASAGNDGPVEVRVLAGVWARSKGTYVVEAAVAPMALVFEAAREPIDGASGVTVIRRGHQVTALAD